MAEALGFPSPSPNPSQSPSPSPTSPPCPTHSPSPTPTPTPSPCPAARWRAHICRQLRRRDREQKQRFKTIINAYNQLLEKSNFLQHWREKCDPYLHPVSSLPPDTETTERIQLRYQEQLSKMQLTNGELAQTVWELNKKQRGQETELQDSHSRLEGVYERLDTAEEEERRLRAQVSRLEEANLAVKEEYDRLQLRHHALEQQLRSLQQETEEQIQNLMQLKSAAAQRENLQIEKSPRTDHSKLLEDLATVSSLPIPDNTEFPAGPPEGARWDDSRRLKEHRSASFSNSSQHKFLKSVRGIFRMRSSASCSAIDCTPSGFFAFTRIPAQVRHSVTAHDGEVNTVKFSPNSKIVATGGSDRKVKLWEIVGGTLQIQKTLEGSNDGVTSIEFDPSGLHLLAGSYDNSARLWNLKDCELKHTLSGHGAKVTAAKFKFHLQEAVTGSHDRTLKIWDLNKPACVKSLQAPSRCSDLVCSNYLVISGHFDKKIRLWDTRLGMQTDAMALLDRVTSLDISLDRSQLLSCSRDDTLTVTDLRMNRLRQQLRAEGFKCGADWTKAIFSPDGNYAAAGSYDGSLYLWEVLTGSLVTSLSGQHRSSINGVSWSLSGEYVVSVDRTKTANLWTDY